MQQGVAVVKPTGHKGRCHSLGFVWVQMFSDSAQVADGIAGKFANVVDVSPEINVLIKHNTNVSGSFRWASFTAKEIDWTRKKVFYLLTFMAYEEKFSFIGLLV